MNLKDEFPLTKDLIYFDNAVMGVPPESTLKVMEGYIETITSRMRGKPRWRLMMGGFPGYENIKTRSKKAFAEVINAKEEEVACVPNATTGINSILNMIPVEKSDNIVTVNFIYPMGAAAVHGLTRMGAETRFLKSVDGIVETGDFEVT